MNVYDWLWALLATTVLLLVAAAILAWRLQSFRRELASARRSLQQSQGEVRRLGLELERLVREHAEPPELVPAQPEPATGRHGGFLSRMGHELRTPLNGILYYAQVLQREPSLTQRQQRGLRTIAESGQHLLSLIDDVVELARIDAGVLELVPVEVRLSEFLKRVADVVRVQAEAKGLAFSVQAAALPSAVRVDDKRLRQVLLHLLGNAIKFTARGQVTLDVRCVPRAAPDGGQAMRLRFEVCDSGIGMDDAQLARLFQPFEPLGTVKERAAGAGLGLVISRQLVRLMGADIQVRSRPGEGSTFWFEIDAVLVDVGADAPSTRGVPAGDARPLPADRTGWQDQRHPAPPPEELAVLRELARIGNMRAIRERADYLKNLDIRYRPFAEQLGQLAEQCQSMAISILVESYVAEAKVAEPVR
jgi:signal transduction histidine kinase